MPWQPVVKVQRTLGLSALNQGGAVFDSSKKRLFTDLSTRPE
jgi:hypothetical protein